MNREPRGIPGRRADRRLLGGQCIARDRELPAAQRRARGDAMEIPALAGRSCRGHYPHCWSCGPPQARAQCAAGALHLGESFAAGDFPAGAFAPIAVGSSGVTAIIADRRVNAVAVTGSESAGRSVASIAGPNIKKAFLKLGVSDPFIVVPSTDVRSAAAMVTTRAMIDAVAIGGGSGRGGSGWLFPPSILGDIPKVLQLQLQSVEIFGGITDPGYGREPAAGIRNFYNRRAIWKALS